MTACQEELPTAEGGDFLPVTAISGEVRLSYEEFGSDLRVLGGYGTAAELGATFLAKGYQENLEARTLLRFSSYPEVLSVRDSTGTTRPDSSLTFVGGKVVAFLDTVASVYEGPVTVAGNALTEEWHPRSATWEFAVDTVADHRPWETGGAGSADFLGTAVWDPEEADSLVLEVDSAAVARWADTTDLSRGLRLDAVTEGTFLRVTTVRLMLTTRPSSNPDTLVDASVAVQGATFVYQPVLESPESGLRVGGAPAWRSIFQIDLPETVDGTEELCQDVACPFSLEPEMVNAAFLVLRTTEPEPGFQPTDTLRVDVRTVLEPSLLPKSPLGPTLAGFQGLRLPATYFQEGADTRVQVPLTGYIQNLIRGETSSGGPVSNTLALLSSFEPVSLQFGSFQGPGMEHPPELRLVLTLGEGVQIR